MSSSQIRPCLVTMASLFAFVLCGSAFAEIPEIISYQGKVTDSDGTPVADGSYTMRFRIYDAATGGTLEWDSGNRSITVSDGVFNVLLGESPQPALNLPFDEDYWLLATFSGVNQTPRQRLASMGYAYMASGLVPGTEIEGSVTSGTEAAIKGTNTGTTGDAYGVYGESESTQGRGVHGRAAATTGTTCGVYGVGHSTAGGGVFGWAPSTTGETWGVCGETLSSEGKGVFGSATSTEGDTHGVHGKSESTAGRGVYGDATATTGTTCGVYGVGHSTAGGGVFGWAPSTTGETWGVCGETLSSEGKGIFGSAASTEGDTHGVHGRSESTAGRGVYGEATATTGSTTGGFFKTDSPSGTGVQGEGDYRGGRFKDMNSNNYCYSGYSTYKTYGTGTNAFVQNHPRDSDRVIVYAAPEGDEVATYTRGAARLVDGEARVLLGETFEWVTNPDMGLTAHLTPRGDCKGLYVASLSTTEMMVRELEGGISDVVFDYIVYGLRIGFEEVSIVQEKQEESYIPSMADHRELYARHPELRKHNSFERFNSMRAGLGEAETLDLSASEALRNAIEEYNPAVHGTALTEGVHAERTHTEARLDRLEELRPTRREQHPQREREQVTNEENESR